MLKAAVAQSDRTWVAWKGEGLLKLDQDCPFSHPARADILNKPTNVPSHSELRRGHPHREALFTRTIRRRRLFGQLCEDIDSRRQQTYQRLYRPRMLGLTEV